MLTYKSKWTTIVSLMLFFGCADKAVESDKTDDTQQDNFPQKFQVISNHIVDESGNQVVLRGLSIENVVWQADPDNTLLMTWNRSLFEKISEWGADIVRLPLTASDWDAAGETMLLSVLDQAVEWAKEFKMYVYIDFHSVGFLPTNEYHTEADGDPIYNTTEVDFFRFWRIISSHYKDEKVVAFYELFNEPTWSGSIGDSGILPANHELADDWIQWKSMAEKAIDTIRVNDTDGLVMVGGLAFCYDLSHAAAQPVNRNNVIYAVHPYPFKHHPISWDSAFGNLSETYPVFVTEFGFDTNATSTMPEHDFQMYPEYQLRGRYRDAIKAYLEQKKIGWTAWCFSDIYTTTLLSDKNCTPTESGQFFKNWLQEYQ